MKDAKAGCEALLNSVLPFAKQMLSSHGELYPYGGATRSDIRKVGQSDLTDSFADLIEELRIFVLPLLRTPARGERRTREWKAGEGRVSLAPEG